MATTEMLLATAMMVDMALNFNTAHKMSSNANDRTSLMKLDNSLAGGSEEHDRAMRLPLLC